MHYSPRALHRAIFKMSKVRKVLKHDNNTNLYTVSGIKSVTSYSNVLESTVNSGLWSPTSMLYDKIRLPFDTGSFQMRWIDRGVDVARTELTAAGLLIGDWDQLILLNGPTPAEFMAYSQRCTSNTVWTAQICPFINLFYHVNIHHYLWVTASIGSSPLQ